MSEKLAVQKRTEFGKGYARRARAAGKIPAVIYGHGAEPLHVNLPGRETTLAVRVANALLTLDVEGTEHLALVKDIQRDPVRQIIEHIDLLTVRRGEKVQVDVPVHLAGEAAPGTVVNQEAVTVTVEAEATHLPSALEVSIEGREAGQHVHASDVELPKNVVLVTEAETIVVNISEAVAAAEETAAEGAEASAEAAE
ncbi:50S ribosomal protein L25/general stress protein Ctc [Sinomonas sp. ASV322]|uniref:50S ribosomal protein L25/general stress protein Ctc n=1 Tax=Sinomonas sp. ASV322 TaxID=3041920 RepID=UPI0027DC5862|nr:50S ribosomal protein L25/general stress protein Ctc [Sinomonas sp. ASV322]MDQ4504323.1 50S ribosomal protein L25/general stress protein Ctc [Sinomonas sp. ASV322]